MSFLGTYLPWFFNATHKPVYMENGAIVEGDGFTLLKPNGMPAHLESEPAGWSDALVKYGRNMTYMGLFRDFTVPLTFGFDGAKILRQAMWGQRGIEAQLFFALSKLDRYEFAQTYKPWYIGELDFSKIKQRRDVVEINVMEGGVSKYLKAYENTTYEIPVYTEPQAVNVYMDGMPFTNHLEYTIFDQPGSTNTIIQPGMGIIVQEGTTQGIFSGDQEYESPAAGFPNESQFFESLTKTFTANFNGSISIVRTTAGSHGVRIRFRKRNELSGTTTDYIIAQQFSAPGTYTYPFNIDIPFIPGDKLHLHYDAYTDSIMTYRGVGGGFNLNYNIKFEPTFCKCLRGDFLLKQLVSKMSNGTCTATSNFLANFRGLVFTSGTALRGQTNSVIKLSFTDFYKTCKPFFTGVGVQNGVLILEQLGNFFQDVQIADVGEVNEMEVEVAEDMVFNNIKAGYRNNTYDNVNGTDEFNVGQQYQTVITKIVKELDLVSGARADMTGIELVRLNLTGKDTTDSSTDNDMFILNISTTLETISGVDCYRLNRPAYTSISGLLHPQEAFNIPFSPKRQLIRWLPYIYSMLDLQLGTDVKFTNGDKNSELVTLMAGPGVPFEFVTEKGDFTVLNTPKLFKPYYFKFKTEAPYNYTTIMETNPYGKIKFTYKGKVYYGFMVDGGTTPATQEVQEWKLLATADTDMTQLI